ncbi:DUF4440 domain-containing protein [Pseudomonas fluorescens]|uniref:nuclear transport factor 2 family protein n=1 Tax=Pseudomonas TaxID=286 RepID=UPI001A936706|nr:MULTISPECIES: DUF4440 domain-containing protein [Pseudomonas]MDZ5433423.1 DUF4440 domain-containing protein [Pseudomonas fluorescens]
MELLQILLDLERSLLSQAFRQNLEEISRLIADDFIEFGASGNAWTKADLIDQLPDEAFIQRTISEFAVKPLSEHIALATYQCHTETSRSLRSSIWRKQNEQWQMLFHQGTPIP